MLELPEIPESKIEIRGAGELSVLIEEGAVVRKLSFSILLAWLAYLIP